MESILTLLASPAGQALLSAGVTQAVAVIGGADPETAAADFKMAAMAYRMSVADWEQSKKDNPTP